MKDTEYYKSGRHAENARKNCAKGQETQQRQKQQRIDKYYENPNACLECGNVIPYETKHKKFCDSSCAAKYNNTKRGARSEKTKSKISESLKGNTPWNKGLSNLSSKPSSKSCKIFLIECSVCGKKKFVDWRKKDHKTCGDTDCLIEAKVGIRTYQNGSRQPIWYFNKFENKEVLIESSWEKEIADILTENNIEWTRPKFIKWIDSEGKTRRYFPDFYLPRFDLYLDPKNPYCMKQDEEKMMKVMEKINIIFGDKDYIVLLLETLGVFN